MVVQKKTNRNPELVRGVGKFSRSVMYHRRGLWAIKAKNGGKFPTHSKKETTDGKAASTKEPRFYPPEDVPTPLKKRIVKRPTKLRASITPGTVLILLAGRFKGKRVVFLKQLEESGLLLVTGPYSVNGVPIRRVNQSYVIATSTKIDVSNIDLSKFNDSYLAKDNKKSKKKTKKAGESEFFEEEGEGKEAVSEEKKQDQQSIDSALLPRLESIPQLKEYLGARFSLKSGMKPHLLKF